MSLMYPTYRPTLPAFDWSCSLTGDTTDPCPPPKRRSIADECIEVITSYPGMSAAEIAEEIHRDVAVVAPVLRKLRDARHIRSEGRFATLRWYPIAAITRRQRRILADLRAHPGSCVADVAHRIRSNVPCCRVDMSVLLTLARARSEDGAWWAT